MRFRDDDRAVTVQVGAVLLFATIIIALSLYQATVVPSQNADVEYKHSQAAQGQLMDVRNAILRSAASGTAQPATVTLGTQYPSRAFLMNPPPATGTLRTGTYDDDTIRLANVAATNAETDDFFDAAGGAWNASTKYLEYAPDYNEYDDAPNVVYGETLLYNHYPGANTTVPLTDQLLVNGDTITLVALDGSVSTTRAGSVSVSARGLSAPYQRVQVTNGTAGPVNVTVPTLLSATAFEDRTGLGSQAAVRDVEPAGDGRVRVVLDPGTYTLRTAKVGVGSGATDPGEAYLTRVAGDANSVTVEARDRFNNPVGGVAVTATEGAGVLAESTRRTDESGRATFEAASDAPRTTVVLEIGSADYERVSVPVGGGAVGGGDTYAVNWLTPPTVAGTPLSEEDGAWVLNTSDGTAVNLTVNVQSGGDALAGAAVDYARNASTFGGADSVSLSPSDGATDDGGNHTTTLSVPEENGTVEVYAASGDDADPLTVRVERPPTGASNDPEAVQFDNLQNFDANALDDEFTVEQVQIQDGDGDDDLDRVEYAITNSSGAVVATRTDDASGNPGQYQVQNFLVNDSVPVDQGETYTLTVTGYDADGNFDVRNLSDTTPTYGVTVNTASAGGGNSIDVEFEVTTSDSGAQVNVQSLRSDGSVRDETGLVAVSPSQPQTETVAGSGQSVQVRVILYDSSGNERDRVTVSYPYP